MSPENEDVYVHLLRALQLGLGSVFLVAAGSKMRFPKAFVRTVIQYGVGPPKVAALLAVSLIPVEALLGSVFLTGWQLGLGAPLAVAVLVVFASGVATNLQRGRHVPCGCFGSASETISLRSLLRLSMLVGACVILIGGFATTDAAPLTVTLLAESGWSGLAYGFELATVAMFLALAGLWLLEVEALALVMQHLRRPDRWTTSNVEAS